MIEPFVMMMVPVLAVLILFSHILNRKAYLIHINKDELQIQLDKMRVKYQGEKFIEFGEQEGEKTPAWFILVLVLVVALFCWEGYLKGAKALMFALTGGIIYMGAIAITAKSIKVKQIVFRDEAITLTLKKREKGNILISLRETEVKYAIVIHGRSVSCYLYLKSQGKESKYSIYNARWDAKEEFLAFVLFLNIVKNTQLGSPVFGYSGKQLMKEVAKYEKPVWRL